RILRCYGNDCLQPFRLVRWAWHDDRGGGDATMFQLDPPGATARAHHSARWADCGAQRGLRGSGRDDMGNTFGRWLRAALVVGGIALGAATLMATPNVAPSGVSVALADPAFNKKDTNENHNNDLGSDDNNEERILKGQV